MSLSAMLKVFFPVIVADLLLYWAQCTPVCTADRHTGHRMDAWDAVNIVK